MLLRVLDWNVNGLRRGGQEAWLANRQWDVATLQEVTTSTFEAFCAAAGATGAAAFQHEGVTLNHRWLYAAVLVREPMRLLTSRTLEGGPSPERTLIAEVAAEARTITVASLAAPPPSTGNWTAAQKVEQLACIRRLVEERAVPLVLGIDQNGPDVDHPDLAQSRWHNDGEDVLFGQTAVDQHSLRDVYRTHLAQHPEELARIERERPDGPLAVSYRRGRHGSETLCRYDLIAASPEFRVIDAEYVIDEAFEAGSDHAAVAATLELQ